MRSSSSLQPSRLLYFRCVGPAEGRGIKPAQPFTGDGMKAVRFERVYTFAPALFDGHEARVTKHGEVSCGRRPGAVKASSDVTRGHLSAAEAQGEQDMPALLMSERGEDRLDVVEPAFSKRPFFFRLRQELMKRLGTPCRSSTSPSAPIRQRPRRVNARDP